MSNGKLLIPSYLYLVCSECYLDKYHNVDSEFISQLLRGEKVCFKNAEINKVVLPFYEEFKMDNLLKQVKDDAVVKRYLHDKYDKKK